MAYASHGGSDCIDYYDPFQTDKFLEVVSDSDFIKGRARGYMLVSVGPDQYLGISNEPYEDDLQTTQALGYPLETPWTVGTDKYFYDPTNGTISTGNIYRCQGELTQRDLLTRVTLDPPTP